MPRTPRAFCDSKVYHVILKGIDNQDIFYDDQDRYVFLENISKSKKKYTYKVFAYCLMNNHIHMVIQVEDVLLSKAIQSLTIRYVYYFNNKYEREGPFVRNRFKSKVIESKDYFLEVCRYVHRNPENANIEKTENYKWSSFNDYINGKGITCTDLLLYYFNNSITDFVKYTLKCENLEYISNLADFELISKLTDDQLTNIIKDKFKLDSIEEVPKFLKNSAKEELEITIKEINKIKGTNPRQISRVIGINKKRIYKILGEKVDKKNRYQCTQGGQKEPVPMYPGWTKRTGTNVPRVDKKNRYHCTLNEWGARYWNTCLIRPYCNRPSVY